jgi:hypothetical protein
MSIQELNMSCFRIHLSVAVILVLIAGMIGCKESPLAKPPVDGLEGEYLGYGNLGGGLTNVVFGITAPDSTYHYTGVIRYRGQLIHFNSLVSDSSGDTLRFHYHQDNTQYSGIAAVNSAFLALHFNEPAGVPDFNVNRDQSGYNMTGLWNGFMTGTTVEDIRSATMTMDQRGQLFYGTIDVRFFQTYQFQINTGVTGSSLQLQGILHFGTTDQPCLLLGNYVTIDSIGGNWQAGTNGEADHGQYVFRRTFE